MGLAGGGAIAGFHLEALKASPHVEGVDLVEPNEETARRRKAEYGEFIRHVDSDWEAVLARQDVPVVDVTVPHYLHYPLVKAALEAGKHVISEKPITIEVEHGVELCELAREKGLRYYVSLNQRLMPANREATRLIKNGEVGRPFLALLNMMGYDERMKDPESWKGDIKKAGGGGLIDTGFHGTYLLMEWLGPIKTVQASTKRTLSSLVQKGDDCALCIFEHESGALSELGVSYAITTDPWEETRHLYCTEASIHLSDDQEYPLVIGRNGRREEVEGLGIRGETTFAWSVKESIRRAVEAIATGGELPFAPEEAVEVLNVVRTAYEAAASGHKVEVPEPGWTQKDE